MNKKVELINILIYRCIFLNTHTVGVFTVGVDFMYKIMFINETIIYTNRNGKNIATIN